MADSSVAITQGSGLNVDTRTEATNSNHRQVIVVGDPSVNVAVAEVASLDVGTSSTAYGQVVRLAGSAQVNLVAASLGSLAVHLLSTNGTIAANIGKVDGTVAVYLHSTGGTLGVNVGKIEGTSAIYLHSTAGTFGVRVGQVDGSISVHLVGTGGTLGVRVGQIDGTTSVYLAQTAGTVTVKIDPAGAAFINAGHTASIFTISGSTSGVSASGVTLISPSANYSFKIFAYSIQTTGIISMTPRFTNGAGTSPTDFWRPLITAVETTSTPKGANLAVTPPGFLFATGTNTTLALLNDGSLVHYSVSYIKESA